MKPQLTKILIASAALVVLANCAPNEQSEVAEYKMTTEIPEGIATPNVLNSSNLGDLTFFDGVPYPETAEKVYDYIDLHNAVDAYIKGIQIASMNAMHVGHLEFGPPNTTVLMFENLMDSKSFWLTPNTTNIYMSMWMELGDEPMVIETPPDVLGIIDDNWFKYVADFGRLGPDKSQGGKFLILPPGYEGDIPDGYFVYSSNTYGNWVIWRGFQVDGNTEPAVDTTKKTFKMYPLSHKDNPPAMNFVNVSGKFNNTIHRMDEEIFNEINAVVQSEPLQGENPEILGALAAIGIKQGQAFDPDERMQKILKEAAKIGAAIVRTQMATPRSEYMYKFPVA